MSYGYEANLLNLGCDPEFFVKSKETGEIVSFSGVLGATKENPIRFRGHNGSGWIDDFLISEDNVAIEVAIPPASSAQTLFDYMQNGFELMRKILDEKGLEIVEGNSHFFSNEELEKGNAWRFGCEPDFCVYKLKMLKPPPLSKLREMNMQNLRTTGGHVHIGVQDQTLDKIKLGRVCDYIVGKWSLSREPALPRRILYGRAGAIRMKKYGIEYRTPGNFWVYTLNDIKEMWGLCKEAVAVAADKNCKLHKQIMDELEETRSLINGKPIEKVAVA